MDKLITSKEYEINFYEVDYKRKALITSIVNFLSDISIVQSEEIEMGLDYLTENNQAWVIYKWNITMASYPIRGEKITVRTWPFAFRKFYAYRQHEILDQWGKVIGTADSIWILIDTEKRKAQRISSEIHAAYRVREDSRESLDFGKLNSPQVIHNVKSYDVRYTDIDTNKHVNNVKYIDWCIETVPLDIVLKYSLSNVKVIYEKETTYGEVIKASVEIIYEDNKVVCLHKIEDKEGNRLTLAKSTWELNA